MKFQKVGRTFRKDARNRGVVNCLKSRGRLDPGLKSVQRH